MTVDCKERCTCKFSNGITKPKCEALRPTPNDPECRNDTQEIEEHHQPVTGSNCSCPTKRCIRGLKLFRGNQRNVFFEITCSFKCSCSICNSAMYIWGLLRVALK